MFEMTLFAQDWQTLTFFPLVAKAFIGSHPVMKGVVFTEFLDFVEETLGYETVDRILLAAAPASGGAYTAVGSYPYCEMAGLLSALSKDTQRTASNLLQDFGAHLFHRFAALYPRALQDIHDPFRLLETIEAHIHKEVRKLYPDAELPSISTTRLSDDAICVSYRSCRPLGQLCIGLIKGCAQHYMTELEIVASQAENGLDITLRRAKTVASAATSNIEARP